jgi:hypothetical protein
MHSIDEFYRYCWAIDVSYNLETGIDKHPPNVKAVDTQSLWP